MLQVIYRNPSELMLIEQLDYNLSFCWFVGLNPDDSVWHPTTFSKNRDRLLNEVLMAKFLELLLAAPEVKPPPSGGQGFGDNAPGKKRAKRYFCWLSLSN